MTNSDKEYMKKWSAFPAKFTDLVYDMHVNAYRSCGCPVGPAAKLDWYGVMLGGGILSCGTIVDAILAQGRCGCGW